MVMTNSKRYEHPAVTVDIVVISMRREGPHVLLIRRRKAPFRGAWALPGGYVEPYEPLEQAARRELLEETGTTPAVVKQLYTFGEPGRDPRGWTISVAYLAILSPGERESRQLRAGSDASDAGWFSLQDPPRLAFDHAHILRVAKERLAAMGHL